MIKDNKGSALIIAIFAVTILSVLAMGIADISVLEAKANKEHYRPGIDEERARNFFYMTLWQVKTGEISGDDGLPDPQLINVSFDFGSVLGVVNGQIEYEKQGNGVGGPRFYKIYIPSKTSPQWQAELKQLENGSSHDWDKVTIKQALKKL